MEKETLEYIRKYHMLCPEGRVVAGVSGGADSICLLKILSCLRNVLPVSVRAVHVHHGLRGEEADRDSRFTTSICRSLEVPCKVVYIKAEEEARKNRISVEEAGRLARYRILEEAAVSWEMESEESENLKNPVKIAVAHHREDNAETILHNLFRGSGLKGLSGITPVRGRIIRPVLWAGREEILAYLEQNSLQYVEDSTNAENEYMRNRLRNQIMPLIASGVNERAVENVLRAGNLIGQADRYFEKAADRWLEDHLDTECRKAGQAAQTACSCKIASLPVKELEMQEEVVRGYIIRRTLYRISCPLKNITAGHIEAVLSLLHKQTGKQVDLPGGLLAEREYDRLILNAAGEAGKTEGTGDLPLIRTRVFAFCPGDKIPKNQYTKWFDYDKIKNTLSVRFRQTGDYITLPDGKRKTVKAYMIDEKIPASERSHMALLADANHIIWIIGCRISEYYKITERTEHVLEVRIDGGTDNGR